MEDRVYKIVPGRGLLTQKAIELRNAYLKEIGFSICEIEKTGIEPNDIQKNIESLVGSVEIPVGVVGPLSYNHDGVEEEVYCLAGTLEGALVSSMNRGAKTISLAGGFTAKVMHQRMVRAPLFIFSNVNDSKLFADWLKKNEEKLKEVAESYSNHARLLNLEIILIDYYVHSKFAYSTGDAAGQNMTTTCTWHSILWALEQFKIETQIEPTHFTLEGNGASDKKVSDYLIDEGRGIRVEAECHIDDLIMHKILRTSSTDFMAYYLPTREITCRDGMVGYNINVANAIAAIFVATGQDLASIHESSVANLEFSKSPTGLFVKLTLYSLVIGTVGGGTHLPKQNEALKLMGCDGNNKVYRFAALIAGFAMGLELSTYAALESGEFAKAHEKLGRNKPKDWLTRQELNAGLIEKITTPYLKFELKSVEIFTGDIDNGMLMNLSKKVNSKLIGFTTVRLFGDGIYSDIIIKSKALDIEVIKGLHIMAASIDPALSDELSKYRDQLEYQGSHYKELTISKSLHENNLKFGPGYFGDYLNVEREIYLLFQERLIESEMLLMDSENNPEKWTETVVCNAIAAINTIHCFYLQNAEKIDRLGLNEFSVTKAAPLYRKMFQILEDEDRTDRYTCLNNYLDDLIKTNFPDCFKKTLVHNDFNPRNVAVRANGEICIYDWELAVYHFPQRDIIELLSFSLPADFKKEQLMTYLEWHFSLCKSFHPGSDWQLYKSASLLAAKEFLVTRVSFYKTGEILMKLKFVDRIFDTCYRIIRLLSE